MTAFPPDVIRLLAKDKSFKEIIDLCKTNRQFYNAICDSEAFWRDQAGRKLTSDPNVIRTTTIPDIKQGLLLLDQGDVYFKMIFLAEKGFDKAFFKKIDALPKYNRSDFAIIKWVSYAYAGNHNEFAEEIYNKYQSDFNLNDSKMIAAGLKGELDTVLHFLPSADPYIIAVTLESAAKRCHLNVIKALIDHLIVDKETFAITMRAAVKGDCIEVVKYLIDKFRAWLSQQFSDDEDEYIPLVTAGLQGRWDILNILMEDPLVDRYFLKDSLNRVAMLQRRKHPLSTQEQGNVEKLVNMLIAKQQQLRK